MAEDSQSLGVEGASISGHEDPLGQASQCFPCPPAFLPIHGTHWFPSVILLVPLLLVTLRDPSWLLCFCPHGHHWAPGPLPAAQPALPLARPHHSLPPRTAASRIHLKPPVPPCFCQFTPRPLHLPISLLERSLHPVLAAPGATPSYPSMISPPSSLRPDLLPRLRSLPGSEPALSSLRAHLSPRASNPAEEGTSV